MSTILATGAPPSPLLTTDEAAAYIRANVRTMERWRSTGYGPRFIKVGLRVAYRVPDLDAWLDRQTREHTGAA